MSTPATRTAPSVPPAATTIGTTICAASAARAAKTVPRQTVGWKTTPVLIATAVSWTTATTFSVTAAAPASTASTATRTAASTARSAWRRTYTAPNADCVRVARPTWMVTASSVGIASFWAARPNARWSTPRIPALTAPARALCARSATGAIMMTKISTAKTVRSA